MANVDACRHHSFTLPLPASLKETFRTSQHHYWEPLKQWRLSYPHHLQVSKLCRNLYNLMNTSPICNLVLRISTGIIVQYSTPATPPANITFSGWRSWRLWWCSTCEDTSQIQSWNINLESLFSFHDFFYFANKLSQLGTCQLCQCFFPIIIGAL